MPSRRFSNFHVTRDRDPPITTLMVGAPRGISEVFFIEDDDEDDDEDDETSEAESQDAIGRCGLGDANHSPKMKPRK